MRAITSASRHAPGRWSRLAPLLCVLAAASACSSASSPAVVPSVLSNTSALTCPSGHRDCTAPGTVRWSLPVQGSYPVDLSDGGGVLNVPATVISQAEFQTTPPDEAHSAAFTAGLAVVCAGGIAEGIDPASGQVRWRQKLASANAENESQSNPGPQAYCDLTVVAPGQVAAANFSPFPNSSAPNYVRILNATTGAVGPQLALPLPAGANGNNPSSSSTNVLDLSGGTLSVLVNSQIYGLNEATGAVRWQTTLQTFTGYSVVGDILYADTTNFNSSRSVSTSLQRVDLSSGATPGPLPLGPGLAGTNLAVIQPGLAVTAAAGPMTTLLVTTGAAGAGQDSSSQIAAVDTATGKALWSYPGTLAELDPASQPPEVAVLTESVPAFGSGSLTLRTVSLATGKLVATSSVPSRLWPVIDLKPGAEGTYWNFYDSALVGEVPPDSSLAGSDTSWYGRLEGLTASGKVRWQGPWSSSDLWVLGDSAAGPPLIIVESCTPAGIVPPPTPPSSGNVTSTCTQGRVYAINA
jgi:hypothetical protein